MKKVTFVTLWHASIRACGCQSALAKWTISRLYFFQNSDLVTFPSFDGPAFGFMLTVVSPEPVFNLCGDVVCIDFYSVLAIIAVLFIEDTTAILIKLGKRLTGDDRPIALSYGNGDALHVALFDFSHVYASFLLVEL